MHQKFFTPKPPPPPPTLRLFLRVRPLGISKQITWDSSSFLICYLLVNLSEITMYYTFLFYHRLVCTAPQAFLLLNTAWSCLNKRYSFIYASTFLKLRQVSLLSTLIEIIYMPFTYTWVSFTGKNTSAIECWNFKYNLVKNVERSKLKIPA